jgi:hypothetical protein
MNIGGGITIGNGITISDSSIAAASLPSGYVTLAGLTWAPMTTGGTYAQSQTYAANFTGLGFPAGTWRSATVAELQSLTSVLSYSDAINIYGWAFSSHAFNIWSSTSGQIVNFNTGANNGTSDTNNFNFLVCKASIVTSGLQFNLQTAPTSGTTWTDSSGNGRNATLLGSPSYVSNNGGGIRLNNQDANSTDYISVPYNIASNTVTVEVVASFNPTSFWATIWGNEIYNTSEGYLAYVDSSTNISYGIPNSETTVTITESNAIRHWIFVINGTQASLFLNGSQVGTTNTIGNQTLFATGGFQFGSRFAANDGTGFGDTMNNSNAAFYPVFYQMRVYNRALSGAEITQNYNAVKGTYGI